MSTNVKHQAGRNDPCPCGSGHKFKVCCGARRGVTPHGPSKVSAGYVAMLVLAAGAILAGGVAVFGPEKQAEPAAEAEVVPNPYASPEPWQYDPVRKQHWHPAHGHWHPGEPPEDKEAALAAGTTTTTVTELPAQPQQSSLPPGVTPEPWQYDAANDQHWHPAHAHWHPGQPPADTEAALAGGTTTTTTTIIPSPDTSGSSETRIPWEYDAVNDQHWHAGHGHWHPGPVPADAATSN